MAVSVMTIIGLLFADRYVGEEVGHSVVDAYLLPALTGLGVYGMLRLIAPWLPLSLWGSVAAKGGLCLAAFALVILLFERSQARTVWATVRRAMQNGAEQ